MSDLILLSDGSVAVITVNNPPVNALSPGLPTVSRKRCGATGRRCNRRLCFDRRGPHIYRWGRHEGVRKNYVGAEAALAQCCH